MTVDPPLGWLLDGPLEPHVNSGSGFGHAGRGVGLKGDPDLVAENEVLKGQLVTRDRRLARRLRERRAMIESARQRTNRRPDPAIGGAG
jgi:hypothetical protein